MKSKISTVCIILGVILVSGALLLTLYNMCQEATAQDAVTSIMPQLAEKIETNKDVATTHPEDLEGPNTEDAEKAPVVPDLELKVPVELLTEEDKKMTEVEINGHSYIGYLTIPCLELELPIMSDWSYPQLKISPCRYNGTLRGEDLVLMAHNYNSHFGRISQLQIDDQVLFTDMDGNVTEYKVVGMDILDPSAVDAMIAGDFDLTLFTCTYGGASRVTVYCDLVRP